MERDRRVGVAKSVHDHLEGLAGERVRLDVFDVRPQKTEPARIDRLA